MQKIFYNGKLFSLDKNKNDTAMLVNNGHIVFCGKDEEVLEMKTPETELIDLSKKYVYPTFFETSATIFEKIETILSKTIDIKNNDADNDENYEKFSNYDEYKNEFLKIQDNYLKRGITTIFEMRVTKRAFTFWKKISEEKLLKIDIIGFVDIKSSKIVMDENCSTYRSYRNHFRLGGYYLLLDGYVEQFKAWLSKPYKHSKSSGYGEYFDEQLACVIKMVLEEKKQLYVEAHGDRAIDEFLTVLNQEKEKLKQEDVFRPIIFGADILDNKLIEKMKKLDVSPCFDLSSLKNNASLIKKLLGRFRLKNFHRLFSVYDNELKFLLTTNNGFDFNEILSLAKFRKTQNNKIICKKEQITDEIVLKSVFDYSSYLAFDQNQKGSFENGKVANFFLTDNSLERNQKENFIESVYIEGEIIK